MNYPRIAIVIGAYLFGLGLLTGMLIEHIRFDEDRSTVLKVLEEDTQKLHQRIMAIERESAQPNEIPSTLNSMETM